jgi:hypothetical protein
MPAVKHSVMPNAFLSHVATDSWYVMIWAEMGIVVDITSIYFILCYNGLFKVMFRIEIQ